MAVALIPAARVEAQPPQYVARVTSIVEWQMTASQWAQLKPADIASLRQEGITVDVPKRTLTSPELGLGGHWLAFRTGGRRRYSTDLDGYVRMAAPPTDTTGVKVFAQVGHTTAIGVLDRLAFVREGQTPVPSVLRLAYSPPEKMNPAEPREPITSLHDFPLVADLRGAAESLGDFLQPPPPVVCDKKKRCPPGVNAAPGCCLDYDGTFLDADGEPYRRDGNCGYLGYRNFVFSTCFKWTFMKRDRPCFFERAILQVIGPSCWNNHKFRNCQNMSETDFDVTPVRATVKFGEQTTFDVRNNTPSNDTCFAFMKKPQPSAKLERVTTALRSSTACGDYVLDHFDSTRHHESSKVKFKAPNKPPKAKCSETYVLMASGGGNFKTFGVEVRRPKCGFKFKDLKFEGNCSIPGPPRRTYKDSFTYSGRVCGEPLETAWDLTGEYKTTLTGFTKTETASVRFSEDGQKAGPLTLSFLPGDPPRVKIVGDPGSFATPQCRYSSLSRTAVVELDDTCPEE